MDGARQNPSPYAGDAITTAPLDSPLQSPAEVATDGTPPQAPVPKETGNARLSVLLEVVWRLRQLSLTEFIAFLKRTGRLWLTVALVVFGLIALVSLGERLVEWARNARERRHELAVATVTPDGLIRRCGEAAQDVTKQVEPILLRTMSYQTSGGRTLVLAFSRTAEESSDWVFLSMSEERTSASYDSPDAKIAALPCLDSTK